jgi:hypothetical protein
MRDEGVTVGGVLSRVCYANGERIGYDRGCTDGRACSACRRGGSADIRRNCDADSRGNCCRRTVSGPVFVSSEGLSLGAKAPRLDQSIRFLSSW